MALKLHKLVNDHSNILSFEHVTEMDRIICTRGQIRFHIMRKFNTKIGMNTTANKLYHLNNLIGLDLLNLKFVHYEKLMKIQFLKYGKTQAVCSYYCFMPGDVLDCTFTERQNLCNKRKVKFSNYCFNSLAIRLRSQDLKHFIPGNGVPKLQGQHTYIHTHFVCTLHLLTHA